MCHQSLGMGQVWEARVSHWISSKWAWLLNKRSLLCYLAFTRAHQEVLTATKAEGCLPPLEESWGGWAAGRESWSLPSVDTISEVREKYLMNGFSLLVPKSQEVTAVAPQFALVEKWDGILEFLLDFQGKKMQNGLWIIFLSKLKKIIIKKCGIILCCFRFQLLFFLFFFVSVI